MILVLDNYDSFVHNLARYVRLAGYETQVVRSDAIDADGVAALSPEALVLSPGPGTPANAGCCVELVRQFSDTLPILGVCLGHQAIVEAFGGRVVRTAEPLHGRTSLIRHDCGKLFAGAPSPLTVCRYHSLIAEAETLPDCLRATAWTDDGVVMAVEHRSRPIFGVQFHPEAILTEAGQLLIRNFCGAIREE
ncbi:anthranilate synthase component II [Botrimarina mediterranea]|uniref:Aminodeoxychorismate/anthranilate synthase component 2 n=1 Tax=Botrimarina mediterranea TaxID=2528022 RepID=A0A518K8M5_9BACT|nr:aminodeoxychorismate/anthranilate synthase component II [Botrimarina mediterranea]QDV74142.1 Aminodeoxychorismate/anthranilate synthase component 2 [Botrimarina mediterranea]QDV78773.1 Aminodeoxychorismate/anthranilate synthase component 2 [Planctomycetes bacterium K2D]